VTLKPRAPAPERPKVRIRGHEGMAFSEAAALFLDERQHDKTAAMLEQTRIQHETVYRLFADFTDDPPLSAITRSVAADFLTAVSKLDRHWGQMKGAQQSTLKQLLVKSGNGEGLSNRTINKYVIALSGIFKWARKAGKFDGENPFAEQSRKKADQRVIGWLPYTTDELNKLFGAPVFHVPADEWIKPERHTFETALRWVPLIALYSGMRLGEVCQLRTEDVQHEGAVWYFNVREGEGQSVKSAAGVRKVPVHSEVIRRGFLKYGRALPAGQLFPALRPAGPDKKFSWHFSQRWTAFRRSVGVDRKRLAFHSFRKNFVSALDEARVPRDDVAALVGHERSFSLQVYSAGKSLVELKRIVEQVNYPGLDLSHLHAG
jgi:integrase